VEGVGDGEDVVGVGEEEEERKKLSGTCIGGGGSGTFGKGLSSM